MSVPETPTCPYCPILRARIATLEDGIEQWNEVMTSTGTERENSFAKLIEALRVDFRVAIIEDPDMTPEQRAYWLDPEKLADPDVGSAFVAEALAELEQGAGT